MKSSARRASRSRKSRAPVFLRNILICLLLALATFAAYARVGGCGFVFDDQTYVVANQEIQGGLNRAALAWAFTTGYATNWHPLTWLSHMVDHQLYGLDPAGHHATNLIIHLATTLLLFLVLARMTGAAWRSAAVAGLFGLHPLHVESVAWVSERKDVLNAFFWVLTMGAYVWYARRPGSLRYAAALVCFALGLMTKQMLVTLPFVLLLLDYWPLGRFGPGEAIAAGERRRGAAGGDRDWSPVPFSRLVV
jgi:hypothetical protein